MVVEQYAGRLPDDPELIREIPGIGEYTAGAILSIAFGRPIPLVDGNVARVLARLFLLRGDYRGSARKRFWDRAAALVRACRAPLHPGSSIRADGVGREGLHTAVAGM